MIGVSWLYSNFGIKVGPFPVSTRPPYQIGNASNGFFGCINKNNVLTFYSVYNTDRPLVEPGDAYCWFLPTYTSNTGGLVTMFYADGSFNTLFVPNESYVSLPNANLLV